MNSEIANIDNLEQFNDLIEKNDAVLVYFSHEKCNVCKVLKPKVAHMLDKTYPNIKMYYADVEKYPEVAGQNSIFAVPTIVVYFAGREYVRKSRSIGIIELSENLERPYEMLFK